MTDPATRLTTRSGLGVLVSSAWIEKPVATRQPTAMEWTEYSVEWRLRADAPIHTAVLLCVGGRLRYARLPAGPDPEAVSIRLGFARYRDPARWPEWPNEKEVSLSLGLTGDSGGAGASAIVVSAELWVDPRPAVRVRPTTPAETGSAFTLAEVDSPPISARAVVLGSGDVKVTHGRWKADPSKLDLLPSGLEFLAEGRRSGEVAADT